MARGRRRRVRRDDRGRAPRGDHSSARRDADGRASERALETASSRATGQTSGQRKRTMALMATQPAERASGFDRRTRIASEIASWGTAVLLIACAALPTTDPSSRAGLLFCAGLLAIFAVIWFHALPDRV